MRRLVAEQSTRDGKDSHSADIAAAAAATLATTATTAIASPSATAHVPVAPGGLCLNNSEAEAALDRADAAALAAPPPAFEPLPPYEDLVVRGGAGMALPGLGGGGSGGGGRATANGLPAWDECPHFARYRCQLLAHAIRLFPSVLRVAGAGGRPHRHTRTTDASELSSKVFVHW